MTNITSSKYWGPSAWYLTHHLTRNLVKNKPPSELDPVYEEAVSEYFLSLLLLMPCGLCQKNYLDKLEEDSFQNHLDSWEKLDKWGHKLHNSVNQMLEKPELSYTSYVKMYSRHKDPQKLIKYPEILADFHLVPDIALSEIQNVKRFLEACLILYPLKAQTKEGIKKGRQEIQEIYDFQTLKKYFRKWIKSVK